MTYLLHQLLEESAMRLPGKEAVRFQGQGLTYMELDRHANQIAWTLFTAGVRRGDRVGIYLHKSLASVISVFGIMKAGGVYVPLDPNSPPSRLAYITRNCDINVLITSAGKMAALPEIFQQSSPLRKLILTDSWDSGKHSLPSTLEIITWEEVVHRDGSTPPSTETIENDLAYILYTSGSTGDPKGVMISHRTSLTFINWCADKFNLTENDRVTSHAPLHFDLSTFDIYATVKGGGTIVLVPEKLSVFPINLVKLLQNEAITVTYMVPSILSLMVNYGQLEKYDLSKLRTVLFAGEVFPTKYLRQLVEAVPRAEYFNLYGPTETNVCTYYQVKPRDVSSEAAQPVPIGRACENIEVFAVDDSGQRVSEPGIEGELWVRGPCVAQGYWADKEKSARSFVPNSFQLSFNEMAYRTGDIVILDEDRINWHFVGRRDHMIKSRGYRIELGEIESALYSHKGVKETAVVAVPDDLIGNRIKAFVVPTEDYGLTQADLRSFCSARLPRYMVPEIFEFQTELPKMSSGKVNRSLLSEK